jgi:hypothetical protein
MQNRSMGIAADLVSNHDLPFEITVVPGKSEWEIMKN